MFVCILVIGVGVFGNEVIKNFVLFGVGYVIIVDFDEIELFNLFCFVLFC